MKKQTTFSYSLFLLLIFLVSFTSAFGRPKHRIMLGLRGGASVSASRFGLMYDPAVSFRYGRAALVVGPTIQKEKMKISGYQLNYEFTLLDPFEQGDCYINWLELYTFVNAGYHNNIFLGKAVCEEETVSDSEKPQGLGELKLSAVDAYAGLGLRVVFSRKLKWFTSIGYGGYQVMNSTGTKFYNEKALGLHIRTGISYQFPRKYKVKY
jgi:hypothetical protein